MKGTVAGWGILQAGEGGGARPSVQRRTSRTLAMLLGQDTVSDHSLLLLLRGWILFCIRAGHGSR